MIKKTTRGMVEHKILTMIEGSSREHNHKNDEALERIKTCFRNYEYAINLITYYIFNNKQYS